MTDEEQVTTPALGSLVTVRRKTPETDVEVTLRLGTAGNCHRQTGIGFLDHLLCAFGRLGRMDLELRCQGDLHVDEHHAIEAVAIGLGRAVLRASGVRAGIRLGKGGAPRQRSPGGHPPVRVILRPDG